MIFNKKDKIFCIGFNKTGTTSLNQVLKEFNYKLGSQAKSEYLIQDYLKRDWKSILKFCKTAEAFQDVPFSLPYTWLIIQKYFPDAKYILTFRDEELWYKSITNFHTNKFSNNDMPPTYDELKNADYRFKGYMLSYMEAINNNNKKVPYDKDTLISCYRRHNEDVKFFFRKNKNFLMLDLSASDAYLKLCDFLNKKPIHTQFPHYKKTKI